MMGETIKIHPISQRAKNRVKEHGSVFLIKKEVNNNFLLESQWNSWHNEKWLGWFLKDKDFKIV